MALPWKEDGLAAMADVVLVVPLDAADDDAAAAAAHLVQVHLR